LIAGHGAEYNLGTMKNSEEIDPHQATVTFLGTGTSVGVPAIGCECDVCTSDNPKNNRTRCAIVVETARGRILVDTPPDLRIQLLREKIPLIHAVLFTHEHADHIFGLDDLRLFPFRLGKAMPLYATPEVEARIRKSFDYAFIDRAETHPGSRPMLEFTTIDHHQAFEVLGTTVTPIIMEHGPHFEVLGFRFGDFAYCTDTNHIPASSLKLLEGVKTFVVDALRDKPHPTHFSVEQAIEVAQQVGADRTYLTHIAHNLEHEETNTRLPDSIELAYDGLQVDATLA
jgi:phosphoribosyl 1,2-cyclic phosphate phosphodiesterase